jgi:TolA-binding protein
MSQAPAHLPPALRDLLLSAARGTDSTADIPIAVGIPLGVPGEVLCGALAVAKGADQGAIIATSEPATLDEVHPRIEIFGRGVVGRGYGVTGNATGAKAGVDEPSTDPTVHISAEAKPFEVAAEALEKTAEHDKGALRSLEKEASSLKRRIERTESQIGQMKNVDKIARTQQRLSDLERNAVKLQKQLSSKRALAKLPVIGKIAGYVEPAAKLFQCRPAAAVGSFAKSAAAGAAGTAAGAAAATFCPANLTGVGVIACVGGGVAVGVGVAGIAEDAIDNATKDSAVEHLGQYLDEQAQSICDSVGTKLEQFMSDVGETLFPGGPHIPFAPPGMPTPVPCPAPG